MTIAAVESAIIHARDVVAEWDAVDMPYWRETQTRYAIVDPIIRGLDWDTSDPKDCYPEYDLSAETGRPDYALFGDWNAADLADGGVAPVVIIEAKRLHLPLDEFIEQLAEYAKAQPRMTEGVAVLTNGGQWRLYGVQGRGRLEGKPIAETDILNGNRRESARTLQTWLGRSVWR